MKPTRVSKSFNGMMATFNFCFPLESKKSVRSSWVQGKSFYLGNINDTQRILTPVFMATDMYKKIYLMDAITGTLYRRTDGKCASSDRLKLHKFIRQDSLAKNLMKLKVKTTGSDT